MILFLIIVSIVLIFSCMLSYIVDSGYNEYVSMGITLGITYFFSTIIYTAVSVYASYNQCEKYNKGVSFKKGLKMALFNMIPIVVIFMIHIKDIPYMTGLFLSPFKKIFGESKIVIYYILSYWCVLSSWLITTALYYESKTDGCKMDNNQLLSFKKEQTKDLDKKESKKKEKLVTI